MENRIKAAARTEYCDGRPSRGEGEGDSKVLMYRHTQRADSEELRALGSHHAALSVRERRAQELTG